MSNIKAWLISLRLRTLPLALSTIFMGSILAAHQGMFHFQVLMGAALTTLFLQILSNLSNDYGDAISGADNEHREGPQRMIQSGVISLKQMKTAMFICTSFALISGIYLLYVSFEDFTIVQLLFLLFGLVSIGAAIKYTVGKNPYGYRGWGDLSVFLFFGWLGVAGTWFLHTNGWQWQILLPASAIGFFSAGVLTINNIRDINSDQDAGKITLVVKMGRKTAVGYHFFLVFMGWLSMVVFMLLDAKNLLFWPVFISLPLFIRNVWRVSSVRRIHKLDGELRNLSLTTLLFVALSCIALFQ